MRIALWGMALLAALAAAPALAATLLYVYDELGRLVAEIDPAADTTLYFYDPAGNLLSVSRGDSSEFRLITFAPTRGIAGDTVTIYGSGFIADPAQNSVSFNGTLAAVTAATTNTLAVTVPDGVTTGPVSVSNANGNGITAQPFVVLVPPVINLVSPAAVPRGAMTRIIISGARLGTARAVTFEQAGISARIVPGSDTDLIVDLTVAGTVPVGAYPFSVTNDAGTKASDGLAISVTTDLLGEVLVLARPLSVHVPAVVLGAPNGDTLSVTAPVSVHLPAVIPGEPPGDSMSVTQPVSVSMP